MQYMVAGVVLVGLLCVLDLLLTLGVIRRLRVHGELLTQRNPSGRAEAVPVGSAPGHFDVTTTAGQLVSSDTLPSRTIVAFFAPDCAPCHDQLPDFVEGAAKLVHSGYHVLAVVVGEVSADAAMVKQLERVAQVVVEPEDGPVELAFRPRGYPSMCLLDEHGLIAAAGRHLDQLLAPAAV